ncbi:MAG: hypothetical protein ACLFUJ_03410 [Phycisphaerae bacterium]
MARSLEPKTTLFHQVLTVVLWLGLAGVLGYGVYAIIEYGKPESTVSAAEIREALAGHREKSRLQIARDVEEMRKLILTMRRIRDSKRAEVGLSADDVDVLSDEEEYYRQSAMTPLDNADYITVYDTARSAEQDMLTLYREFLAARQMDLGRAMSYEESYEQAATPRPTRPALDEKILYRDITRMDDEGGRPEFLREITNSKAEVTGMVENAKKLLEFTRKSNSMTGDGISPDITDAERAMIGYRGEELMPDEMDFTYSPDTGNFDALPGRRLETGGWADTWLYVDTWYVIGPFPGDRRRENLDVRFGPEANVNLDDVFVGKDDRKIHWEYKKVGWTQPVPPRTAYWKIEPRNVTSYGIYYAYTEIYSDVQRDVWIATATDDYGKLWINDELVWKSPKTRKPYNATENVQSVTLQQGQNKILYRVENAGGTMGFSLMIRLNSGPQ